MPNQEYYTPEEVRNLGKGKQLLIQSIYDNDNNGLVVIMVGNRFLVARGDFMNYFGEYRFKPLAKILIMLFCQFPLTRLS